MNYYLCVIKTLALENNIAMWASTHSCAHQVCVGLVGQSVRSYDAHESAQVHKHINRGQASTVIPASARQPTRSKGAWSTEAQMRREESSHFYVIK